MWGNRIRDAGERGGLRQVSGETSQTLDISCLRERGFITKTADTIMN